MDYNDIFIELNSVEKFTNALKNILQIGDIFILKIYYLFFYMGYFSPEEFMELATAALTVNAKNPDIYETIANVCKYWEPDTAIKYLETALLLNKKAKKRYIKKIKKIKSDYE